MVNGLLLWLRRAVCVCVLCVSCVLCVLCVCCVCEIIPFSPRIKNDERKRERKRS